MHLALHIPRSPDLGEEFRRLGPRMAWASGVSGDCSFLGEQQHCIWADVSRVVNSISLRARLPLQSRLLNRVRPIRRLAHLWQRTDS